MGTGCEAVSRIHSPMGDIVSGRWNDGRLGTFRAVVKGPAVYGGTAFTEKGTVAAGGYAGYKVLLDEILRYFKERQAPSRRRRPSKSSTFMKALEHGLERDGRGRFTIWRRPMPRVKKEARKLLKGLRQINENNRRQMKPFQTVYAPCLPPCRCSFTSCSEPAEPLRLVVLDPGHFHARASCRRMPLPSFRIRSRLCARGRRSGGSIWRPWPLQRAGGRALPPGRRWSIPAPTTSERMIGDRAGDLVVLAGKQPKKTNYILESVKAELSCRFRTSRWPSAAKISTCCCARPYAEAHNHDALWICDLMTNATMRSTSDPRADARSDLFGSCSKDG